MFSHPVAIAFALICLFALAVAVHIAWPTLQPVVNWLRLVARDLFGHLVVGVVYLIYAIAILAAELWKFFASRARGHASRLAFRLFGALDCCACKKRLRKPLLWLRDVQFGNTGLRLPNISHTYCKPCLKVFIDDLKLSPQGTLRADPSGNSRPSTARLRANEHAVRRQILRSLAPHFRR